MALANLGAWVPEIFGDDAEFQKGTGAYRISSAALGRDLEEDLSIHPKGITDWGVDDQGKNKGDKIGRRTAIDLVIEHGNAANAKAGRAVAVREDGRRPGLAGLEGWAAASDNPTTREIERLAKLSRIEYEQARKEAAKELGFRAKVLDDLVAQMREPEPETEEAAERDRAAQRRVRPGAGRQQGGGDEVRRARPSFGCCRSAPSRSGSPIRLVTVGKMAVPLGDYWLSHPERRQYAGIEFAPPGTPLPAPATTISGRDLPSSRRQGDCSKFLAHMKDNVARGDEETYLWIVGWWAQIFQQPSVKMETALVLRGPFGAGKTKIGEVMGSLIGDALSAGRLAALHHRAIQLAHGVAAGAARRRSVLGRRQEEPRAR